MTNPYTSPAAEVIDTNAVSIACLPRVSTWLVMLFSMLTLGLYIIYWLYNRLAKLNLRIENKIPIVLLHIYVGLTLLSWFFQGYVAISQDQTGFMATFAIINGIGSIVSVVCFYTVIYKMRNRICDELLDTDRWGGIKTFFFSVWYINYKINQAHDQNS